MKINLLAVLAALLCSVGYAAGAETADPISFMENDLGQATAELSSATPDGTPIELTGCGCGGCCGKGLTVGVEATYLKPNSEFLNGSSFGIGNDFDFEAAPRIWLGVENCDGLGVRGRYWQFDAEAGESVDFAQEADVDIGIAEFATLLEAHTIDLEATKRFCCGGWDMLASCGVRRARLDHDFDFDLQILDLDDDVAASISADASRRFEGTGITLAVEGSRPLRRSGLSLYWNLRGSVLWGTSKADVRVVVVSDTGSPIEPDEFADSDRVEDTLFVGELQAGVEWRRHIQCVCSDVFARAVFESQWWSFQDDPELDGDPVRGDVDFYGAAFSAGISR